MPSTLDAPGARILAMWRRLSGAPGGSWLFHRLLARMVPYTGALGARIVELSPGHSVCELRDRRGVRNHLDSVHAVALANLAELCSGTAMLTALAPDVRGIVTRLDIEYHKKARGTLTARADVQVPDVTAPQELLPEARISDEDGDLVATARVTWRVRPRSAVDDRGASTGR
ncbi:MAG: hotdog fold domain-containing protein [Gemmatimonadaceae bacterium]